VDGNLISTSTSPGNLVAYDRHRICFVACPERHEVHPIQKQNALPSTRACGFISGTHLSKAMN